MYIFSPKNSNRNTPRNPEKSPQKKKFQFKKFNINWKLFWKIILGIFIVIILSVAGVFAYFAKDLPSPGKVNARTIAESTKIYDRTGNHLLYDIHGEEKRTLIPMSEIPDVVKYSTIALEDSIFYSHSGFDLKGIIKAGCHEVSSRIGLGDLGGVCPQRGGSTITQQLIKNTVLTSEKKYSRKIKELILSIEIEQMFSKDEILEMYLNEIPYGSNAYGIEAAAQTFFSKHARELSLDEAALLASLPRATSYYSPYGSHPEDLKARQEYALKRLYELGYITENQMNEAISVDVLEKINTHRENINAPHFVMYIKEYLEKKYGQESIEEGGFKVYTTLDWDKQQLAERVVREGAEKNIEKYNAENAALVAMDPHTGQILAMVGSKDYFDKSIDGQVNVAIRDRQPGSSFKPYVYLTAFTKGYTPETNLWDVDTDFSTDTGETYNPKNYDGKNSGLLQIKDALARSLNVPAVKTLYLAGVKDSITTAKKLGITTLNQPDRYGLSLVLGGGEVKLLDHVNAFSTLATGGIFRPKTAIMRIEGQDGKILEKFEQTEGERVIEEKYIAMIDYVLSTNSLRAPVFGENNPLRFDSRPVAAKTGTTNEWRDGWTMGYTPSLAVGVWVGNNNNTPMAEGADGSYVAAPIWRAFIEEALQNYDIEKFPKYDLEEEKTGKNALDGKLEAKKEIKVCKIPDSDDEYCLANDNCPESEQKEKKFSDSHSILYYVKKDDPRGDAPKNPEDDPQYKNWEKAIKKFIKDKKDYANGAAPSKECKLEDFEKYGATIKIKSPSKNATVISSPLQIKTKVSGKFDIKKVTIYVDESQVYTSSDSSITYSYEVPNEKKTDTLKIKATVEDKKGFTDTDTISIKTNIPQ